VKHKQGELLEILILFVAYFVFFEESMQMKITHEQNTKCTSKLELLRKNGTESVPLLYLYQNIFSPLRSN